jgi:hypothetical protein
MKLTVFVSKLELETALRKERSKRMERSSLVNKNQKPKKKKKQRESPKQIFELGERRIIVFDLLKRPWFLDLGGTFGQEFS